MRIGLNSASRVSALSSLVNKNADLSWDMAIRLAKAVGNAAEGWTWLQFQSDAAQMEERSKKIKVETFPDTVHV